MCYGAWACDLADSLTSAEADVYFEAASWSASGRFSSEVIPGDRLTLASRSGAANE